MEPLLADSLSAIGVEKNQISWSCASLRLNFDGSLLCSERDLPFFVAPAPKLERRALALVSAMGAPFRLFVISGRSRSGASKCRSVCKNTVRSCWTASFARLSDTASLSVQLYRSPVPRPARILSRLRPSCCHDESTLSATAVLGFENAFAGWSIRRTVERLLPTQDGASHLRGVGHRTQQYRRFNVIQVSRKAGNDEAQRHTH